MTNSKTQKVFQWIFFVLSIGTLIAGGIYIEKIVLTGGSVQDYVKAALFIAAGIAITATSFFKSTS